jgi:hypothetical protein
VRCLLIICLVALSSACTTKPDELPDRQLVSTPQACEVEADPFEVASQWAATSQEWAGVEVERAWREADGWRVLMLDATGKRAVLLSLTRAAGGRWRVERAEQAPPDTLWPSL